MAETNTYSSDSLMEFVHSGDSESRGSADSGVSTRSSDSTESDSSTQTLLKHNGYTSEVQGAADVERQPRVDFKGKPEEGRINADNSFWIKIVIIFSLLDVLLLATIFMVGFGYGCWDHASHPSEHCLNCTDVYLTYNDKLDNIHGFTIQGDMCCSDNEAWLIQKYVIKRYRSDHLKASTEGGFLKKTAIHLDLDQEDENSIKEGTNQTLKWSNSDLVHGELSVSPDRTEILVERTGLYYISLAVVFDDKKGDVGKVGLDPMTLQLYRDRQSEERHLLLETKETHCALSNTRCSRPCSGQGVFTMEKGDSVFVQVSKPCGLVLRDKSNHLDMYLI